MDKATRAAFIKYVMLLERRACAGDDDAAKSLACMALIVENYGRPNPDGEVINLAEWRDAA